MSDDNGTTTPEGGNTADEYKPPATQADLDRIITDRLNRERAKFSDYDELKQHAGEYQRLVEASKSDQQRLEERASAAESKVGPLELDNARLQIALEKGLTLSDARRLVGSTRDELLADADEFLKDHPRNGQAVPDLRAAAGGGAPAGAAGTADEWIRSMAGRSR